MKKISLPFLILIFLPSVWNECVSQSTETSPKNYFGLFVGIEWNSFSSLLGVEYERVIWKKDRFTLGAKGKYIFIPDEGNLQILNRSYGGSHSFPVLMPTVDYMTSPESKYNQGLFLHSGLGVGWRRPGSGEVQNKRASICLEAGFGFHFRLGSDINMKWTNSVLFAGEGGITFTKISLGF